MKPSARQAGPTRGRTYQVAIACPLGAAIDREDSSVRRGRAEPHRDPADQACSPRRSYRATPARALVTCPDHGRGVLRPMEVTRKQLLAGGAALALAGCGAKKTTPRGQAGRRGLDPALPALRRLPVRRPRRSRCATRSSATGAGSTPARRPTCTSTRPSSRRRWPSAAAEYLGVQRGASSPSPTRPRWASGSSTPACSSPATRCSRPSTTTTRPTRRCGSRGAKVRTGRALRRPRAGHGGRDARARCAARSRRARRSSR